MWYKGFLLQRGVGIPRIIFTVETKISNFEDYLVHREISILEFDGFGGVGSPRGKYQKTNQIVKVEGFDSTV
jgi:hypothetical protein